MMTRKQIDTSREIRLWTTGIVMPIVTTVVLLAANPDVRDFCKDKFVKVKTWTKTTFSSKKKEETTSMLKPNIINKELFERSKKEGS